MQTHTSKNPVWQSRPPKWKPKIKHLLPPPPPVHISAYQKPARHCNVQGSDGSTLVFNNSNLSGSRARLTYISIPTIADRHTEPLQKTKLKHSFIHISHSACFHRRDNFFSCLISAHIHTILYVCQHLLNPHPTNATLTNAAHSAHPIDPNFLSLERCKTLCTKKRYSTRQ